jgi:hypothetical protein
MAEKKAEKNGTGSLEHALKTISGVMSDLTSLEVQTYTGNLDVVVKDVKDIKNFEAILESVKSSAAGNLKLRHVTKINIDGDGLVLVPETTSPNHVQEAHDAALKAGHEVRQGLLTLFADLTGLAISK